MHGVDPCGAFDRVVVLGSEGTERCAAEAGANARLVCVRRHKTGKPVHLSLDLCADDRQQSGAIASSSDGPSPIRARVSIPAEKLMPWDLDQSWMAAGASSASQMYFAAVRR